MVCWMMVFFAFNCYFLGIELILAIANKATLIEMIGSILGRLFTILYVMDS